MKHSTRWTHPSVLLILTSWLPSAGPGVSLTQTSSPLFPTPQGPLACTAFPACHPRPGSPCTHPAPLMEPPPPWFPPGLLHPPIESSSHGNPGLFPQQALPPLRLAPSRCFTAALSNPPPCPQPPALQSLWAADLAPYSQRKQEP